jgi:hypothetical protein
MIKKIYNKYKIELAYVYGSLSIGTLILWIQTF